ncbi:MAG TPA: outer membrane beta-barrel protein [Spongiibacteraceae bacterium]|nr:outer membrane beta-barrel protein [Spongiibacteraceae bacterium]
MKAIKALLFSAVALSPVIANAGSNWYGLVSVGQSTYDISKGDTDDSITDAGLTLLSSKLDDTDTGMKFQAGYQFSPNFAVEGGYVDLGRANYKVDVVGGNAKLDLHAWGFNVDAVGILPVGAGFSIFGKVGGIFARVDSDISATGANGSASDTSGKNSFKPTFGLGAAYDLNETLSVRIEYERFADLKSEDAGSGDVDLATIGLVAHF